MTHCFNANEFSTVYFWYHSAVYLNAHLASECRSFFENGNRRCSGGGVVLYDPSYRDSYTDSYFDFTHSKLRVHGTAREGSNQHRDFCVTIYT